MGTTGKCPFFPRILLSSVFRTEAGKKGWVLQIMTVEKNGHRNLPVETYTASLALWAFFGCTEGACRCWAQPAELASLLRRGCAREVGYEQRAHLSGPSLINCALLCLGGIALHKFIDRCFPVRAPL